MFLLAKPSFAVQNDLPQSINGSNFIETAAQDLDEVKNEESDEEASQNEKLDL